MSSRDRRGNVLAVGALIRGLFQRVPAEVVMLILLADFPRTRCACGEPFFEVLHAFVNPPRQPAAALIEARDGGFYGTTREGGSFGLGTVFKIDGAGVLTIVHSFGSSPEGAIPTAALIEATDGSFYGTTRDGGSCETACGTVFKINSTGELTKLHSFSGPDGSNPYAALIEARDGSFYGTTQYGGSSESESGTVFKINSTGELTTLHSFSGPDGAYPYAALIEATDGSFYGTTLEGGSFGQGTVFKIDAAGTLTTLHSFSGHGRQLLRDYRCRRGF